jgi:hypothetical protein
MSDPPGSGAGTAVTHRIGLRPLHDRRHVGFLAEALSLDGAQLGGQHFRLRPKVPELGPTSI